MTVRADGDEFRARVRLDTPREREYLRHGGILPFVLRRLLAAVEPRAVRGIAVIGNLARDTIDGGRPRVGGAPFHAARALRLLGGGSRIVARCAEADRRTLVGRSSRSGCR